MGADNKEGVNIKWLDEQVSKYKAVEGTYKLYARILRDILTLMRDEICPEGFVQARAKGIASFAGKCVKYHKTHRNPVEETNDLCGGRIIVHTTEQVELLSKWCRRVFKVNEPLSKNATDALKAREFGYGSVHAIVEVVGEKLKASGILDELEKKRQRHPEIKPITENDLKAIAGSRSEIQLRTVAQHAWADFEHDISYKSEFEVPRASQRESGQVAAMVETIDNTLVRISQRVSTLHTNNGIYREPEAAKGEIDKLQAILRHDHKNVEFAYRVARLHLSMGQYQAAIDSLQKFEYDLGADPGCRDELADLCAMKGPQHRRIRALEGYLRCLLNESNRLGDEYQEGQSLIQQAAQGHTDTEMLCWLAETAVDQSDAQYMQLWKNAHEVNPSDPRSLAGYLRYTPPKDLEHVINAVRPRLDEAMELCCTREAAWVDLPYCLYYLAEFHLLQSGEVANEEQKKHAYEATYTLNRAISLSHNRRMLEDALKATKRLLEVDKHLMAVKWCQRTLQLALSVRLEGENSALHRDLRPSDNPDLTKLLSAYADHLKDGRGRRVLMIAGGCDPKHPGNWGDYEAELEYALQDFQGLVICGGTTQGISGIIGGILAKYPNRLKGIGYLPATMPLDKSATEDFRYSCLPKTDGENTFSPLEPIQAWVDLLHYGISPKQVTLLGVNGGRVAGFEYHFAAMLGADVGIVEQSGRMADELAVQTELPGNANIHFLPNKDRDILRVFVGGPRPQSLNEGEVSQLAEEVRQNYEKIFGQQKLDERNLKDSEFPKLQQLYKDSNRAQVLDIEAKLARLELRIESPMNPKQEPLEFTPEQIETLARWEHARYVAERVRDGFQKGTRNNEKKLNPTITAWDDLPDDERTKDYAAVRAIPGYLKSIGYRIVLQ